MKVVIITQGISRIVEPLLISEYHQVVGIIENAPRVKRHGLKKKIYNIGMSLYNCAKDRPASLRKLAARYKVPYYYMDNSCDCRLEAWLKKINPDIMVVYSMSELLHENIFSIPRFGTINLHGSLLPKYRGPEPWAWMYYNMDLHPGTTIHYIDKGEDTGDIICQEEFDIALGTRLSELLDYGIGIVGVRLLLQAINEIERGRVVRRPQDSGNTTLRAVNVDPEQYAELINWQTWPIERIWHFLRGTEFMIDIITPAGGLFMSNRWLVLEFIKCEMPLFYRQAEIYREKGRNFIACKEGKIYLARTFSFKRLLANLTQ